MMENNNTFAGGTQNGVASPFVRLAGTVGDSIVDGPGLRFVLFCQGCPHHCPGCHNPNTHSFSGGSLLSAEDIFGLIQKYPLCRAVTFSGGEPFCQSEALLPLAHQLKKSGYELAAYSGYTFEQLQNGSDSQRLLLASLDTLVDGLYLQEERDLSLRFRGSRNQRVLDIPASLSAGIPVLRKDARWTGTPI